jgi:hypothetical protein
MVVRAQQPATPVVGMVYGYSRKVRAQENEPLTPESSIPRHFPYGDVAEWLKAAVC